MSDLHTPSDRIRKTLGVDVGTPPFSVTALSLMNPVTGALGAYVNAAGTLVDGNGDTITGGAAGTITPNAFWAAAGDLAVGSANDTAVILSRGSALQVLRVNAAGTNLEYATPAAVTQNFLIAVKTADEARTTQTLANDNELVIPLAANQTYAIEAQLSFTSTDTDDLGGVRYNISTPALTTLALNRIITAAPNSLTVVHPPSFRIYRTNTSGSITTLPGGDDGLAPIAEATGVTTHEHRWNGLCSVGGAGGNFVFRWAQWATVVDATSLLAGSFLRFRMLE